MKKFFVVSLLLMCSFFTSCKEKAAIGIIGGADGPTAIIVGEQVNVVGKEKSAMYTQITQEAAKSIMNSDAEYVLLDTREQEEFDEGHIPGAVLLPYTEIENKAKQMIPDKDTLILVYCRSGRRSKIASQALVELGYTNVKEFGGIIDWKYEVVK